MAQPGSGKGLGGAEPGQVGGARGQLDSGGSFLCRPGPGGEWGQASPGCQSMCLPAALANQRHWGSRHDLSAKLEPGAM